MFSESSLLLLDTMESEWKWTFSCSDENRMDFFSVWFNDFSTNPPNIINNSNAIQCKSQSEPHSMAFLLFQMHFWDLQVFSVQLTANANWRIELIFPGWKEIINLLLLTDNYIINLKSSLKPFNGLTQSACLRFITHAVIE